ncbi:MAG: hypothetical protein HOQ34_09090 [Gemmatimonadaceae bacterium]|nr:hypothetical protein [Gemmatimonadaceae bacterium]
MRTVIGWVGAHPVAAALLALVAVTRCPGCWIGTRVPRINKRNGSRFQGCSRYPRCDYTS